MPPKPHCSGGSSTPCSSTGHTPIAQQQLNCQCTVNTVVTETTAQGEHQEMANSCLRFETLAEHSALNREEYTAMLFVFMKECEKVVKTTKKTVCDTVFN